MKVCEKWTSREKNKSIDRQ